MAIDFPNSPTVNQTVTVGDVTWIWDGTTWRSVGQPTPGRFVVSETAPSGPTTGDAWFKSSTGQTFVYYDSFWVETSVSPTGPAGAPGTYNVSATAPASPAAGNAWFNTTDGRMYVWSGTEWFEPVSGLQGANGVYNFGETAPAAPAIGQGWVNTNTGKMYIWSGTEWFEPTNNGASASTVSLTGGSTIIPQTPSTIGLITKAAPGQTADLQQWQNLNGTVIAEVSADGSALFSNTGQNFIINGAFDIWQRGTSFSGPWGGMSADRWAIYHAGGTIAGTVTRETFTPGAAPLPGLEGQYYLRKTITSSSGNAYNNVEIPIEDVRTLAGQVVTISFYARADAARTMVVAIDQRMGTGGSANSTITAGTVVLSTSWQRYSLTTTLPSMVGRTVGTGSFLLPQFQHPMNATYTIDMWGVQLEPGSVATPFKRNSPNLQAELAACQRYYQTSYPLGVALQGLTNLTDGATWICINTSDTANGGALPVTMRATPTFAVYSSNGGVAANSARDGGGTNITGINLIGGTSNSLPRINKNGGLPTVGNPLTAHWTATAEF